MRATRRYWAVGALAMTFGVLAPLLDRPLLLVGAVALGGFLLAAQYAFYRALRRTLEGLVVDQTTERERVVVDDPIAVTLAASVDEPAALALTVEAGVPVATTAPDADARTATIEQHASSAHTTFQPTARVAGRLSFEPPTVATTDPLGLLTESLQVGPAPTLTVEPRSPRNVHVGEGGERVAAAFGEHQVGRLGPGFTPMELREYVPGDAASRIDWKATARLNRPFVREDEAESDRMTALVVDHRAAMGVGPAGETKLDYARQTALAIVDTARVHDDPIGLYAVDDGGLTVLRAPESTPDGYAAIRHALHDVTARPSASPGPGRVQGPADAHAHRRRLGGDASRFGTTLEPYFDDAAAYVHRVDAEPLFRVARSALGPLRGSLWTVVFTDDTNRAEVREAVKVARRGDDNVVVFLTPGVLFEPGGLADLDVAYDRYREFESFRRELARMDRVSAYEVAPGDRVEAVLDARRRRRANRRRA